MNRKCESIIRSMVERAGEEENYEIIRYGLGLGVSYAAFFTVCVLISIFMGNGLKGVLVLVPFYFIRIYAGGYHAKTRTRCMLISILLMLLVNFYLVIPIRKSVIELAIFLLAAVHLFNNGPVEAVNKPLDDKEKVLYKNKLIKVLIVVTSIVIISYLTNFYILYKICGIGIAISDSLIVLDYGMRKIEKTKITI